jgi:uncharacterized protein YegJ (DUF2314 family)
MVRIPSVLHWFFVLCSIIFQSAVVKPDQFLRVSSFSSEVLADDGKRIAISMAQESLSIFRQKFESHDPATHGFLITVVEKQGNILVPVGVLVDSVSNGRFEGKRIANDLLGTIGERIECTDDNVCDWRYVDTFVLKGGYLYREMLGRLSRAMKRDISDEASFLLSRPNEVIETDFQLCKQICSFEGMALEKQIADRKIDILQERLLIMARHNSHPEVVSMSLLSFASMYGNEHVLKLFLSQTKSTHSELLHDASMAGNSETLISLISMGSSVDTIDGTGRTPLHYAVQLKDPACVKSLIHANANLNISDIDGCTPIFKCRSADIARLLIKNGASIIHVTNNNGESPESYHRSIGQFEIAELIAGRDGIAGEPSDKGKEYLLQRIKEGLLEDRDGVKDALERDFGFVIPCRTINVAHLK